jgi:hypothetical protein
MTILERLVVIAATDSEWAAMIAEQAEGLLTSPTCTDWERKGGSHYKDGQFTKK